MVGILLFSLLVVFIVRLVQQSSSARKANHQRPEDQIQVADPKPDLTDGLPIVGRPRRARDESVKQLVRARRFAEASAAVTPDDLDGRARLAIARGGPAVDLLRVIRERKPRRLVRPARAVGFQLYPWLGITQPSLVRNPRRVEARVEWLQWWSVLHKYGRVARGYAGLARVFPEADDRPRWLLRSATAHVLQGADQRAKPVLVELANDSNDAVVREQASQLSAAVGRAARTQTRATTLKVAKPRTAIHALTRRAAVAGSATIGFPGEAISLLADRENAATAVCASVEAIEAEMRVGHHVYVGYLQPDGSVDVSLVTALNPRVGMLQVASGETMLWDEFERRSTWGGRMVVSHPARKVPGSEVHPAPDETLEPAAATTAGVLGATGSVLARQRALVDAYPDDALVGFAYSVVLTKARNGGVADYDPEAHLRFLATCAVRFPDREWARQHLERLIFISEDEDVSSLTSLHSIESRPWDAWGRYAKVTADPERTDAGLRETLRRVPAFTAALQTGAQRAADRWDGADVDAYLDMFQRTHQGGGEVSYFQKLREVAWRGTAGALESIAPDPADPGIVSQRLALAANTGKPAALEAAALDMRQQRGYDRDGMDAQVILALHSGDPGRVAESFAQAAQSVGAGGIASGALADAALWLTPPAHFADAIRPAVEIVADQPHTLAVIKYQAHAAGRWADAAGAYADVSPELWKVPDVGAHYLDALLTAASRDDDQARRQEWVQRARAVFEQLRPRKESVRGMSLMECAVARHVDPDEAWELVRRVPTHESRFVVFALVADIAERRGDLATAAEFRARAANPGLIRDGLRDAARCGLHAEVTRAIAAVDSAAVPPEVLHFYGEGGDLPAAPPAPVEGVTQPRDSVLDRLAYDGHLDLVLAALRLRVTPRNALTFADGTREVAYSMVVSAVRAGRGDLAEALQASRHPAYAMAAEAAHRLGVDAGISADDLAARAPGLSARRHQEVIAR